MVERVASKLPLLPSVAQGPLCRALKISLLQLVSLDFFSIRCSSVSSDHLGHVPEFSQEIAQYQGSWMAQSVKCLTLGFGSDQISRSWGRALC